jgi:S-formylglutathione hydrolase FrmB
MAIKRPQGPSGRLVWVEHASRLLADNPLGDPTVRRFPVWLPPQYDQPSAAGKRFPVFYDLVGYLGAGPSHVQWRPLDENIPERMARLVHERRMGPVILVFPDCFTALGGNQYVNSSAIGRYGDYLTREIVPFIDREFRTLASRDHRGAFGKSSGGYGALVHGMKHPDVWGGVACHSGDAYFDFCYRSDWPNTLNELARHRPRLRKAGTIDVAREEKGADRGLDDGRVRRFLEHIWKKERPTHHETHALMNLCMAATYDPDPRAPNGFRLPFNLETGELLPARWQRWLQNDPINMVQDHAKALRSLRALFVDCGWRDQYHIHYGSRILSKRLTALRVPHVYEEFDDTHSGIDYRLERSLPFLFKSLKS